MCRWQVYTDPFSGSLNLLPIGVQVGKNLLSHLFWEKKNKSSNKICMFNIANRNPKTVDNMQQ